MNPVQKTLILLSLSTLLSACNISTSENATTTTTDTSNRITVSGSVGDGPIVGATVTIRNRQGTLLASTTSDQRASYFLDLQAGPDDFPLTLEADNGTDLVTGTTPDFGLLSVLIDDQTPRANLNPHSTLIVKTAQAMPGGLTQANLLAARQLVIEQLNFGLDTALASDPITLNVDSENLETLVHASESLAEMLRRTSRALGGNVSEDALLTALAADLSDGSLDGRGASGSSARYTAVSYAAGLQVVVEAMLHDLHVNGALAEGSLSGAMESVLASGNKPPLRNGITRINRHMLEQAKAALVAIQVIDSNDSLKELGQALRELEEGATTEDVQAALGRHNLDLTIDSSLGNCLDETVKASDDEIDAIITQANATDPGPAANNPPTISGTPSSSLAEGENYTFTPSASDPDGDSLTFSVSNLPAWASFDPSSGTLTGRPGFSDAGDYRGIEISVSDGSSSSSLAPFSIHVGGSNRSPSISGVPATQATEGQAYRFTPTAADADGDSLIFSVANLPAWASFDPATGTLSGTPDYAAAGRYSNIVVSVSDGSAGSALAPFTIDVANINRAPTIAGTPAGSLAEGANYTFIPSVSDPDGDSLTFSVSNLPAWASFDPSSGTLSGTPGAGAAGSYRNILIQVTDGAASATLAGFDITVTAPPPAMGAATLTSATLTGTTAVLVWTQDNATPAGGYDIILDGVDTNTQYRTTLLTASIPGLDSSLPHCFAIQARYTDSSQFFSSNQLCTDAVAPTNGMPKISGQPETQASEGTAYRFTPNASDPDGDSLTFSITGRPAWASFDATTGTLSGTPGYAAAGSYPNIQIRVSDGSLSATLPAFTLVVANSNRAPSIGGTPVASVAAGTSYSFTPVVSDPDGDPLSFSATNLPAWASLDPHTGTLSGSPGAADVGVYQDIGLQVSDGSASASLGPITIEVTAAPATTGSADLAWQIPTTRTDGSPLALSEIAGYRIYIGSSSDNLSMIVDLNDGTATRYTVSDLASGSYFFSVTTYDTDGNESAFSNIAQKTIL